MNIQDNLENEIQKSLSPGEHIIWQGRPSFRLFFWQGFSGIILSILWIMVTTILIRDPSFSKPISWIFPLMGLIALISSAAQLTEGRRTSYAVSNHALMVAESYIFGVHIRRYLPERIKNYKRIDMQNGEGSIVVRETHFSALFTRLSSLVRTDEFGMYRVRDVQGAEHAIKTILKSSA